MNFLLVSLKLLLYVIAFSGISPVACDPDASRLQDREFVSEPKMIPVNSGTSPRAWIPKLDSRQQCSVGYSPCEGTQI